MVRDLPAAVAELRSPLLVVDWRGNSGSDGADIASRVPGARLATRPGGEHYWYDPEPESLNALIREFILEHSGDSDAEQTGIVAAPAPSGVALSPRELEVLALIAAGKSNPEIAEELVIAPGTVGRHVSNLLAKTGLKNRVEDELRAQASVDRGLDSASPVRGCALRGDR